MKYVYQDFYGAFRCMASECPDTCCKGWEIIIDEESYDKYNDLPENESQEIISRIKTDEDGDRVFIQKNGECPFLDRNKLCRLITKYGDSILCEVCRLHPRFIEEYGDFTETALSLSCPAASMIMRDKENLTRYCEETTDEEPQYTLDTEYIEKLKSLRADFFKSLETQSVGNAVESLISGAYTLQSETDGFDYEKEAVEYDRISILSEMEILTDDWSKLLEGTRGEKAAKLENCETYLKNIASYFAFRYILKAVNDGDVISKARFVEFSVGAIEYIAERYNKSLPGRDRLMYVSRLYSKEIEHDEDNIEKLYEILSI